MATVQQITKIIIEDVEEWCLGKNWFWRAALVVWFIYIFFGYLSDPQYGNIISPINLCFHELGHLIFAPFGAVISTLGGSLCQCLVPILGMWNFFYIRDYFSIALCCAWLMTNLFGIATYIADARAQQLELVSPFSAYPIHDWNFLLGKFGLLWFDHGIAFLVRFLAVISMLIFLGLSMWMLYKMFLSNKNLLKGT